MSTTEFLNVDEITTPVTKALRVNGEVHKMKDVTVGDFIDEVSGLSQRKKEMAEAAKQGKSEEELMLLFFESMVNDVVKSFPSLKDTARNLSITQLTAIVEFISGALNEAARETASEEKAEDQAGNE